MLAPEVTAAYVALANLKRKELLPPLMIIVLFKLIEFPLSLVAFRSADSYLLTSIAFDCCLIFCLARYHNAEFLRKIMRVSEPIERRYLPQIKATITIMTIGVIHYIVVLLDYWASLYLYTLQPGEVPFFYETFGLVRTPYKAILVLAIWSMMLDAIWLRRRVTDLKKKTLSFAQ